VRARSRLIVAWRSALRGRSDCRWSTFENSVELATYDDWGSIRARPALGWPKGARLRTPNVNNLFATDWRRDQYERFIHVF